MFLFGLTWSNLDLKIFGKTSPRSYSNDLCAVKLISVAVLKRLCEQQVADSPWHVRYIITSVECSGFVYILIQKLSIKICVSNRVFKMVEIAKKIYLFESKISEKGEYKFAKMVTIRCQRKKIMSNYMDILGTISGQFCWQFQGQFRGQYKKN